MKQFIYFKTLILILSALLAQLAIGFSSFAQTTPDLNSATVLETSLSKRTISLNVGTYEGFKNNERGTLLTRSRNKDSEKMIFLGKAELVKVFPHNSIWNIKGEVRESFIHKKLKVMILREDTLGRGAYDLPRRRKTLAIKEMMDMPNELLNEKLGGPKNLAKVTTGHPEEKVTLKENRTDTQKFVDVLDLNEFEILKKDKSGKKLEGKLAVKNIGLSDELIKKHEKQKNVDGRELAILDRLTSPDFSMEKLYDQQKKDSDEVQFTSKSNMWSVREVIEERRQKQKESFIKAMNDMESSDPNWTDQMSDQQLENYVQNVGIASELQRQLTAANHSTKHELTFQYSLQLNEQGNDHKTDQRTNQLDKNRGQSLSLGYEFYFLRRSRDLKNVTWENGLNLQLYSYDIGTRNAQSSEYGLYSRLSFYPFKLPTRMDETLFFLGIGASYGIVDMRTNSEKFSYSMWRIPTLHLGIKYRVSSWDLAIRALLEVSSAILDANGTERLPDGILSTVKYWELKQGIGISYFF